MHVIFFCSNCFGDSDVDDNVRESHRFLLKIFLKQKRYVKAQQSERTKILSTDSFVSDMIFALSMWLYQLMKSLPKNAKVKNNKQINISTYAVGKRTFIYS